jgi:hypothetical protein
MDCCGQSLFMNLDILDMLTWTIPFDSLWKSLWNGVLTWLFWTCDGQYNKIWSLMILIEESLMNFHGLELKTENIINNLNSYIIINFFNTCLLFIAIHAIIFYCYSYVLYLCTYIYIVLHKFMIICYKLCSY